MERIRILVAEDDGRLRKALVELLRLDPEFDVVADVGDGESALEHAGVLQPEVLLTDLEMPRMGGLEATRKIRQLPNGQSLRIIAMTANAFASDRADCMAAGMDDFLAKPIDPDLLFVTLLKWLDNPKV